MSKQKIIRTGLWILAACFVYMLGVSIGDENWISAFVAFAGVISIVVYLLATTEIE